MKKRTIALLMAVVMLFGATIGGTIAWLKAETSSVVNTFTVGDINLTLAETFNKDTNNDGVNDKWEAKLVPGTKQGKDPYVTVIAESEKCWVFVKVEEANNAVLSDGKKTVQYDVNVGTGATQWTQIGATNVYYYNTPIDYSTENTGPLYVFKGDTDFANGVVVINNNLTKEIMNPGADKPAYTAPTITITAYAVQYAGFEGSATTAWNTAFGA